MAGPRRGSGCSSESSLRLKRLVKRQPPSLRASIPRRVRRILRKGSSGFIQTAKLAENGHVMCVVEKAGFEPRTLGTEAERALNCATRPVATRNTLGVCTKCSNRPYGFRNT